MNQSRRMAVTVLDSILINKIFFSEAKKQITLDSPEDNAFINMLVLTALRHLVYIKKVIKKLVKKKLPDHLAETALILGACELLYLKTPAYAVINSYVEIAKHTTNQYIGGFVNAVLRNINRQLETFKLADTNEFFPSDFFKILNRDYGKKTIQKIQKFSALEAPLDITAKNPDKKLADILQGHLLPNGTIRLANNGRIESLAEYEKGTWWIQDFSASLAVQTLSDLSGKSVLDICAAPGGKTAQLINAGAQVTALDISAVRLQTLQNNLQRLNFNAKVICADGLDYLQNYHDSLFDVILLDAPCSATGTIRRHPELVHLKKISDISKQADLQKQFLHNVGNALKLNGILVYCVCSIAQDEGEKQINEFLHTHPDFINLPIKPAELFNDNSLNHMITPEGYIRTLPQHLENYGGCDSFFVARLQKVK